MEESNEAGQLGQHHWCSIDAEFSELAEVVARPMRVGISVFPAERTNPAVCNRRRIGHVVPRIGPVRS
jgi:hypothetical protein